MDILKYIMKIELKIILSLLPIFIFSSCNYEQKAWEKTKNKNSLYAFESFNNEFPESNYLKKSQDCIDSIRFNFAKEANTLFALSYYIENFPDSKYKNEVAEEIKKIKNDWNPFLKDIKNVFIETNSSFPEGYDFDFEGIIKSITLNFKDNCIEITNNKEKSDAILRINVQGQALSGSYYYENEHNRNFKLYSGAIISGEISLHNQNNEILKKTFYKKKSIPFKTGEVGRTSKKNAPFKETFPETEFWEKLLEIFDLISNNTYGKHITKIRGEKIKEIKESKSLIYLNTQKGNIYALNKFNGIELWKIGNNDPSCTLIMIEDNKIFSLTTQDSNGVIKITSISANNATNGELIWRKKIDIEKGVMSAVISQHFLFLDGKNEIISINVNTGEIENKTEIPKVCYDMSNKKFIVSNNTLCIEFYGCRSRGLISINFKNDSILWKSDYNSKYDSYLFPSSSNEVIIGLDKAQAIYMSAINVSTGKGKWAIIESDEHKTPYEPVSYESNGFIIYERQGYRNLVCFDISNGEEKWRERIHCNQIASLDSIVYVLGAYELRAININNGEIRWKFMFEKYKVIQDRSKNYPGGLKVSKDKVYVKYNGRVIVFDATNGFVKNRFYIRGSDYLLLDNNSLIFSNPS